MGIVERQNLSVITFLLQDIVSLFSFPVLLLLLRPNIFPLPISSSFYFFAGQIFSLFSFSVFLPLSILSYSEYFSPSPPLTIYFHPFPSPWRGVEFDLLCFSSTLQAKYFLLQICSSSSFFVRLFLEASTYQIFSSFSVCKYFPLSPSPW